MKFLSKIKSYFEKPKILNKESLSQVFQDYLKIKTELQVSDIKLNGREASSASAGGEPLLGINFKVSYQGSIVPFWLAGEPGITQEVIEAKIQNALTMIAVGLALNLNLVEISQALKDLTPVIK